MSIALRFPGNMLVNVAPDTRFEIFPKGDYAAYENVEYHIGDPSVCFVVKRVVVESQPRSFLGLQLAHSLTMGGDVEQEGENAVIKVMLKEHDPLLFPYAFDFMNQTYAEPSTAAIPTIKLSKDEIEQIAQLVNEFLAIENPLQALLFKVKSPKFKADEIRLSARGRLTDGKKRARFGQNMTRDSRMIKATISQEGIITCVQSDSSVTTTVTINLHKIPTEAPWPKSIMEDDILAMQKAARASARARMTTQHVPGEDDLPTLSGDELPPVPETDDDLMPYPYPVDQMTSFFIPATAIVCKMDDNILVCEGIYRCEDDQIRIDALDQEVYSWLWLEVNA